MPWRSRSAICAFALVLGGSLNSLGQGAETLMSYLARSRQPSPEATGSVNLRVVPMPPTYRFEQPEDTRGKWCFGKGEPQVLGPRVDVPRYEWGYFGAHYNCDRSSHVSYYGDYFRWRLKKY